MRITIQLDGEPKPDIVVSEINKSSATSGAVPSRPPPELLAAAKRLGALSAGPAAIPTLASGVSVGASKTEARLAKDESVSQSSETRNSRPTRRGLPSSKKRRGTV